MTIVRLAKHIIRSHRAGDRMSELPCVPACLVDERVSAVRPSLGPVFASRNRSDGVGAVRTWLRYCSVGDAAGCQQCQGDVTVHAGGHLRGHLDFGVSANLGNERCRCGLSVLPESRGSCPATAQTTHQIG